jgi:hypothetical protein
MDRDGNLPGFIRLGDTDGPRFGQDNATINPWGGFRLTLMAAEAFQACAACAYEVGNAARE